jgi:hypothetical protein
MVRPFLGYGLINVNQRAAATRYNSLQVFLNQQLRHGLAFQAAYTYSRNIGTTPNQDSEARNKPVQDAFHPEREKAVTDQDIPQSLVLNYIWDLPFFQKSTGFRKVLLSGWQVNGIATFRSGRPVDICLQNDNAGLGDDTSVMCERPDIVGNPILAGSNRSINEWFNTSAFAQPANFTKFERALNDLGVIRTFAEPYPGSRPETLFGMIENQMIPLRRLLGAAEQVKDTIVRSPADIAAPCGRAGGCDGSGACHSSSKDMV